MRFETCMRRQKSNEGINLKRVHFVGLCWFMSVELLGSGLDDQGIVDRFPAELFASLKLPHRLRIRPIFLFSGPRLLFRLGQNGTGAKLRASEGGFGSLWKKKSRKQSRERRTQDGCWPQVPSTRQITIWLFLLLPRKTKTYATYSGHRPPPGP